MKEIKEINEINETKKTNESGEIRKIKKTIKTKNVKEKILGVINKLKEIIKRRKSIAKRKTKNPNEQARTMQNKTAFLVIAGLGAFVFAGWFLMSAPFLKGNSTKETEKIEKPEKIEKIKKIKKTKQSDSKQESVEMAGTVDPQFTQKSSSKALDKQQQEIKDLNERPGNLSVQLDFLQNSLDKKKQEEVNDNDVAIRELQTKLSELEVALLKKSGSRIPLYSESGAKVDQESSARGITTTNFSFFSSFSSGKENQTALATETSKDATSNSNTTNIANITNTTKPKTANNYVPSGTFAKAVLLSGADTNAGVHGQTDTTPIVMRILDNGTLPNGKHSSLKGCFVTAAAYGDASSERGQIRLQHLSCIRPGNHILDIPVEGTINDMGGNDGIRGHVVMRNNKLIWNAGVSGFLSGIGSAMQQSATTQSISPLGITNAIKSGKVFEHSAYGGANTALGKLADYYIKLADMYHPIVQVHAGSKVNIVFLKGFSLFSSFSSTDSSSSSLGISEQVASEKDTKTEITNTQGVDSPVFTQAIKNSHLGRPIAEEVNNMNNEGVQ